MIFDINIYISDTIESIFDKFCIEYVLYVFYKIGTCTFTFRMKFGITNSTLKSLTLTHIFNSPIISSSASSTNTNYFFSKLKLSNIFTNFYFSSLSNLNSLSISKSTFKEFTDSVIFISKQDFSQKEFRTPIDETQNENYNFNDCVFQKTRSNGDGGAIRIFSENSKLNLKDCGFTICLATNNGGAIEFEGLEYSLIRTCFLGCLAVQFGQAFDLQGPDELNGKIEFNSYQQCATVRSPGLSQSLFMRHGTHTLSYINSSFNHITDVGSCFTIAHTTKLMLHYSNFIDNSGHNCFWLHRVTENDDFMACNIIGNTANEEVGMFTFENSSVKITGTIFLNNKAPVYFISGELFLYQCMFDIKQSIKIIIDCNVSFADTAFNIKNLQSRPLPSFVTWSCWNLGAPSPTPSQSLVPIEHELEEAVLGIWVLAGIFAFGLGASFFGYYLMSKTQDKIAIRDTQMKNIEMRDF